MSTLQFAQWASEVEMSFYAALAARKIDHDKLDASTRKVVGRYDLQPFSAPDLSTRMQITRSALTGDDLGLNQFRAEGLLKNTNTIEEYRDLDRTGLMHSAGKTVWDAIVDGTIYSCPSLLTSFYVIFFADLKKYKFTYHFAFPALHSDPLWKTVGDPTTILKADAAELRDKFGTWRLSTDKRQHGFFLAKREKVEDSQGTNQPEGSAEKTDVRWTVGSIGQFEEGFFDGVEKADRFIALSDPSTHKEGPAWMARNYLALAKHRWRLSELQLLCYRDTDATRENPRSLIFNLQSDASTTPLRETPMLKVSGWERNENGKMNSRTVTLADYMDPKRLADQSVDLNLKLMKWRIAPELILNAVKETKCLLLGAGTLGSYVSRNLMGWGVRHITFVDNGRVSFSNPVRQPLFNFQDCQNGGAQKAVRAAEALQEIYPGVVAKGHAISVPMAGHPITDEKSVKDDYELLEKLIDDHDAIFLLMDTRESRWLPTVMGKQKGKIVMNAALGFDTYMIMRHGMRPTSGRTDGTKLGCYFCSDVVAPADSIKDQTLDQQCTVTRPGVAAIASALLVELLISILQHPQRGFAGAPATRAEPRSPTTHPLGLVPHQIRGFLATFDNLIIRGSDYDCCSACSEKVLTAYEKDGWEFVKKALNERNYVEELSGLAEVQRRAEEAAKAFEMDDDEGDGIEDIDGEGELL